MISVICPTIAGREHHLARCKAAYEATTTRDFEWIPVHDQPTCGVAWNIGIALAKGDVLHLTADDLEPHPGWLEAALKKIESGFLPAPRILKPDGSLESCGWNDKEHPEDSITEYTRIPIAPREWFERIGPMLETHYANDRYFSHRARRVGLETIIARRYLFTHHWAKEGRLDHRMVEDDLAFREALA